MIAAQKPRMLPTLTGVRGFAALAVLFYHIRGGMAGYLHGAVIDFVDLQWFPVFNLADAALTVGIGLLLVVGFFTDALDDAPPAEPS